MNISFHGPWTNASRVQLLSHMAIACLVLYEFRRLDFKVAGVACRNGDFASPPASAVDTSLEPGVHWCTLTWRRRDTASHLSLLY